MPVREAPTVAGHAVRQLYLDAGAVDVAVETGDQAAARRGRSRRWTDMVATRTYLTGGLGSRHRDEAFGDPYELPPDRAYAETCAAIASVMLGWRLLLATGEARFADQIERTAYNGVLSGLSLDGTQLLLRQPAPAAEPAARRRPTATARAQPWYPCACCPPNLMRFIASWEQYLATADDGRRPAPPVRAGRASRRRSPAARSGSRSRPATRGPGRVDGARRRGARHGRGRCRCACRRAAGAATAAP